jgi:hypothetical protein
MKKLKVDIEDIALAMESSEGLEESVWYLDTDTGEVIHIDSSVMEDIEDEDDEAIDDYPEWMKEMAEVANVVLADNRGRFKKIPEITSHESYRSMERFILDIKDESIRNRLFGAIKGKGAFRRFKDTISEWPEIEKQWYEYRDGAVRREVLDWLESIGIEPEDVKKD